MTSQSFYKYACMHIAHEFTESEKWFHCSFLTVGIGMDSCVIPLRHGGLSLVQTTDFFYPLVEDPYMMVGEIYKCCRKVSMHLTNKWNSRPFFYRDELPVQMFLVICTPWASQSVTICSCFSASVKRWMRRWAGISAFVLCCIIFGFTFLKLMQKCTF